MWGPRPAELIGKTSMKAVWKENYGIYFYGEYSLADPSLKHGKMIKLYVGTMFPPYLEMCWYVNNV